MNQIIKRKFTQKNHKILIKTHKINIIQPKSILTLNIT